MEAAEDRELEIQFEVLRRRYKEARLAGLTMVEAQMFADSGRDIGELRKLVKAGCPVDTLREIVL